MLKTWQEMDAYREHCENCCIFNYWSNYIDLTTIDNDYNDALYQRIEEQLIDWLKSNAKKRVYYSGDLEFEFESHEERDTFDNEFGDKVAFKLRFA